MAKKLVKKDIVDVQKETKELLTWLDEDMHGMMSWVEEVNDELKTLIEEFEHKDADEGSEYDWEGARESLVEWCESLKGAHGIETSSTAWTEAIEDLASRLEGMFKTVKTASEPFVDFDEKVDRVASELVKVARLLVGGTEDANTCKAIYEWIKRTLNGNKNMKQGVAIGMAARHFGVSTGFASRCYRNNGHI